MAPRDGWLARQIDKITAQEPSMRMALRFTNGGGRGMTDERLCGWLDCGLPAFEPCGLCLFAFACRGHC